ncbi:hypothetical protein Y1Q_0022523 [Alligator mississippiensis]|uniref:Uncharacterized protein n=1 Tax=Alligator mississippiensis TaxID=8496 RepID=A0A151NZ61_ALLMI|nr:hypothetical protein Y1Q_0022523 [Alligator mississippiensis]
MSPVRLLSLPCPAVRRLLGWQQGAEEEYWAQMAAHALVKKLEKKARPLVELEKVLWCPGQPNRCVMLPASLPGRWGAAEYPLLSDSGTGTSTDHEEEDETLQVTVSMKFEEASSDELQLMGALQDPGGSRLEEPKASATNRTLEETGQWETPGPRVPKEEAQPDEESDSPDAEETWEWSTDESCSGWCPGGGPSPGAGAGTLIKADQQPPEQGPVNLEMQRTSSGRLGERGSRTSEPGQVQKGPVSPPKHWESLEVSKVPGSVWGESGVQSEVRRNQGFREEFWVVERPEE